MKTKLLHFIKPIFLALFFLSTSTLFGQRPGIECGCEKYGQYVTPAVASPAMGQTLADDTKLSPKGKYRVVASYAPPPNTSHLTIYDTENNAMIYYISSILDEWGFDPTEQYFVIKGYDESSAPWVKYLILDPDKSITGERATEFWICTPAGELFTSLVHFSPHGNYILHSGITGDGFLMLHIYNSATGDLVFDGSSSGIATADTAVSNAGWGFSPDEKDATFVNTYLVDVDKYALFVKRLDTQQSEFIIQEPYGIGGAYWRFSPCGDYFVWLPDYGSGNASLEIRFYSTAGGSGFIGMNAEFIEFVEYKDDGHYIVNWEGSRDKVDLPMANQKCPDETAPTWPDGAELSITDSSGTRVVLHWPPALDTVGVSAYRVYVGGDLIEEIGKDTAFIVKDLMQNTPYTLGIKAGDETGNWSSKLTKGFETPVDAPPTWPGFPSITFDDLKSTEVKLNWTLAEDDFGVEGYAIFMDSVALDTIFGELTYKVINLIPDTNYAFSVEAYDAANQWTTEGPSVNVRTPVDPDPTWPADSILSYGEVTETSILLRWPEANDDEYGVTGYEIYQDAELIHSARRNVRQYDVTGLEEGTTYHFTIIAKDIVNNESDSLQSYCSTLSPYIVKPLIVESGAQMAPDIDNNIIVWEDNRNENYDIYMYDLKTKTETRITDNNADQRNPRVWGKRVVWEDSRNGNTDIYMYDPVLGEYPICTNSYNQTNPDIYETNIVWSDGRDWKRDIYMYDLIQQKEITICGANKAQYTPSISKSFIVWQDYRSGSSDIYMYNLISKKETVVCDKAGEQFNPSVYAEGSASEVKVVYADKRTSTWSIYMYYPLYWNTGDPGLEWKPAITNAYSSNQEMPHVDGNQIVYLDNFEGEPHIYKFELTNPIAGESSPVCLAEGGQFGPRTSKGRIVWSDYRNGNWDIYLWDRPPGSDLSISLEEKEDPVTVGEDIVYKLNIGNMGPDDADSVEITCSLPQGLVLRKNTISGYESSHVGNTLVCKIPLLPADSSLTWTLTFSTRNTGVINFSAEIDGRVFDPDPSNNKVTETTDISLLTHEKIAHTHNFGMDLLSNGTILLAYIKNDSLYYSWKTKYSGWTHEKIEFGGEFWEYEYCDIVADRSGRVHIVQSQRVEISPDSSVFYLYHYIKYGNSWDKKLISINHKGFYFLDLELAADDELQLTYLGFAPFTGPGMPVMYMKTTNQSWGPSQKVGEGYDNVSMAIDSKDNPHLSFYCTQDFNTRGILYSTKESTGEWNIPEVMDPDWGGGQLEGMRTSIQLDQQDNPHISFVGNDPEYGAESIKTGIKEDDKWKFSVVDSGYYVSGANAIAIDPNGHDHIFYATRFNTYGPQMRYAFKYSDTWIRQIINDKHFSQYANIKMDREGNLHMAYIEFDMDLNDTYLHYVMRPYLPFIITDTNKIDFGCTSPGEIIEKTIAITNPGFKRVYIDKFAILGNYPFKVNTEHPYLDPGETDSVKISFEPEVLGIANTALRIWFNGTEKMFIDIELLAKTSMPILQLDYDRTKFYAEVGESDTCYFYVSNKGDLPLDISNIKVEKKIGPTVIPTDFDIISHNCSTLISGDSCVIVIAFSPSEDKYQSTTLYIYSNDITNPELSEGLKGYIGSTKPISGVNTNNLDFGYVSSGSTIQKDIIISNSGNAILEISSIEIEGVNPDEFSVSHSCTTLEPDESCPLTITFHPSSDGDFDAVLTIASNATERNVQIQGSSLKREITIIPEAIDFGIVQLNNDTMCIIEVTNSGEALIEDIGINIGTNTIEFSHTKLIETLQTGETITDTVKFAPLCEGHKLAEWIIEYDNGLPTADTVPLTGIGLGEPHPLKISAGAEPLKGMIPLEVSFYSTATGGTLPYDISWDFGDGNSDSSEDPTHIYQQPGKHWASVSVSDDQGNSSADSIQILVGADLVPVVRIYASQEIKDTVLDVQFASEILGGRNPISILWDFGDGTISTVQNPQHSYLSEGEYEVNLFITDDLGTTAEDNTLINFTLHNLSLAVNTYSEDDTLDITTGLTELFISGIPEPLTDYMFSGEGFYTFNNLIKSDYSIKVTPDTIAFSGYLPTYLGGALALSEADYLYLDKGIDTVDIYCISKPLPGGGSGVISGIVIDAIGEKALKLTYNYTDDDPPVSETMVYLTNADSETLVAFDRTKTDGQFSFMGLNDGSYNLLVDYKGIRMSENNAAIQVDASNRNTFIYALVSDDEITLEEVTSVEDVNSLAEGFTIYPNPITDNAYIRLNTKTGEKLTIKLFNATGTLTKEIMINNNKNILRIPVSDLSKGIYLLTITGKDINYTMKIVKK